MKSEKGKGAEVSKVPESQAKRRKAGADGSEMDALEHFDPVTGNIRPRTEPGKEQNVAEKAADSGVGGKRSD